MRVSERQSRTAVAAGVMRSAVVRSAPTTCTAVTTLRAVSTSSTVRSKPGR